MKGLKFLIMLTVTASVLLLSGCGTKELEDRGFPLTIGIDKSEEGMILSFDFPDLTAVSDGKNPSGKPMSFSVEAGAYYEAQKAYENNSNRILDYNHLKAIILGRGFLADETAVRELFAWLEGEEVLARNTRLFVAEDKAASILTLTGRTGGTLGKYLEQMAEGQEDFKENQVMTVGKLMNQWHNQNELLLLPMLSDSGGFPAITAYAVVDAFQDRGNLPVEDAMKAFLTQGLLERFTYRLKDGGVVEIRDIQANTKIGEENGAGSLTFEVTGAAFLKKEGGEGGVSKGRIKKLLDKQLAESLNETALRLKKDPGIDLSNSYRMLGGYHRGLYQAYQGRYEEYQKGLTYAFCVDITMVNEE